MQLCPWRNAADGLAGGRNMRISAGPVAGCAPAGVSQNSCSKRASSGGASRAAAAAAAAAPPPAAAAAPCCSGGCGQRQSGPSRWRCSPRARIIWPLRGRKQDDAGMERKKQSRDGAKATLCGASTEACRQRLGRARHASQPGREWQHAAQQAWSLEASKRDTPHCCSKALGPAAHLRSVQPQPASLRSCTSPTAMGVNPVR